MSSFTRNSWQVARKRHRCDCCHYPIDPGERYFKTVYSAPDFGVTKMHRFCFEFCERHVFPALEEEWGGGYYEWDPYQDFHSGLDYWYEEMGIDQLMKSGKSARDITWEDVANVRELMATDYTLPQAPKLVFE